MTTGKHRSAERRKAGFAVRLLTPRGHVEAVVRDVSRTGVRLRLEASVSGIPPTNDVEEAEQALRKLLPGPFSITLAYERLGPLIQKIVTLRRVGLPEGAAGAIDACCSFAKSLEDDELGLLALKLPRMVEDVEEWFDTDHGRRPLDELVGTALPGDQAPEATPSPCQSYRASMTPLTDEVLPNLLCRTDVVTAFGVRLVLEREAAFGRGSKPFTSATSAGRAFVKRFGENVELRLFDSRGELWCGRMRVSGFELPSLRPGVVLVSLSHGRRLPLAEMRLLGLAGEE